SVPSGNAPCPATPWSSCRRAPIPPRAGLRRSPTGRAFHWACRSKTASRPSSAGGWSSRPPGGRHARRGKGMVYWFLKGICCPFGHFYSRRTRGGLEHLRGRGPVIVVSTHASSADAIILGSASPRPIHFIVLQKMYALLFIRWFYWGMGTIPVRAEGQASKGF